jgi:UDP-glucose 4-epimerase
VHFEDSEPASRSFDDSDQGDNFDMRALITGGAGFIGSHLAERLIARGDEVAVLDDLSTGSIENLRGLLDEPRFSFTQGSATDDRAVAPLVDSADTVFHLAAAVGVKLVVKHPLHTIHTNVHGTETVLRHAAHESKRCIVVSTSEVYGKTTVVPFREDADLVMGPPSRTRWGYAASKLLDEFIALGYWKEQELPVTVVRLFNTVGPRQNSRYGMVLPTFVRQALAGAPMLVHGDGRQTRSFTWVGDVVSALVALAEEPKSAGEVFNIGNGAEISILDLARKVKAMMGSASLIQLIPYNEVFDSGFEDMPRRVPDISKIRDFIGYRPTVHLDEIVARVIDFWATAREQSSAPASNLIYEVSREHADRWAARSQSGSMI